MYGFRLYAELGSDREGVARAVFRWAPHFWARVWEDTCTPGVLK